MTSEKHDQAIALLTQVKETFRQRPDLLDMEYWHQGVTYPLKSAEEDSCGTTLCVAGLICVLSGGIDKGDSWFIDKHIPTGLPIPEAATKLLGVHEEDAGKLFNDAYWSLLDEELEDVEPTVDNMCRAIDAFIAIHYQ